MYLDGSRKNIVAWVAEGLSDAAIAERLRVSPSTVRYWRERNGVVRAGPAKRSRRTADRSDPPPETPAGENRPDPRRRAERCG